MRIQDFADLEHPPTDWFYAPEAQSSQTDDSLDTKGAPNWHGSCVASKAVGARNGVSKNSKLIVIKASTMAGDLVYAFSKALDDIIANDRQKKSVVVFAAVSNSNVLAWSWSIVKASIKTLFDADATVVVPSGNFGDVPRSKPVSHFPAVWESPSFPLIVAGAVNNEGVEWSFSQGPNHVTIWAPGEVSCAKQRSTSAFGRGTSFSTGMASTTWSKMYSSDMEFQVAGLVAYGLGLPNLFPKGRGQTAANAKSFLQSRASWARQPGGRGVIWNGQDGSRAGAADNVTTS